MCGGYGCGCWVVVVSEADESVGRMVGEYQRQAIELGAACAMLEPFTLWRRYRRRVSGVGEAMANAIRYGAK